MSAEERGLDLRQWCWARFMNLYELAWPALTKQQAPRDRPAECYVADVIRVAAASARKAALEEACLAVCMYCGKRAPGFGPPIGPNAAYNWSHARPDYQMANGKRRDGGVVLCAASAIRALAAQPAPEKEG